MTMPDDVEAMQIAAGISGLTFIGGAGNDVILVGNATLADIYALFAT